jgi:signal transduction histidine kinase
MKQSIFSRLMIYLSCFFLILCGATYWVLSIYFEIYYTESRTEALEEKTQEVRRLYDQGGLTLELQNYIDTAGEEGTVIQLIQNETNQVEEISQVMDQDVTIKQLKTVALNDERDGSVKVVRLNTSGNGQGISDDHTQNGNKDVENNTELAEGQGKGQENGEGINSGREESIENQVRAHQDGESFVTLLGNNENEVEWLTNKVVANDGTQIIGRIPYYSVKDVIVLVQNFLLVFILVIFSVSLIFAYFFARSISKPIVNLNRISKEMGSLNFSEKYRGRRRDEIGQLGETLNQISKKLEKTIEELQSELNKERTLEKMRQRFTAQVSHEIQTPLTVIKSYAEALEDDILSNRGEEKEYFITIEKEADKISSIASDLLDLSQIESGAYRIKKEKTKINDVVETVIQRFLHTDAEKNIHYDNDCSEGITIEIDRSRMEQVFDNLLNNAIKHVSPKNGLIEIITQTNSNEWRLSVYNDGNSIPENEIDNIWDYFYMAKSNTKGTGLGLAIVKGIIEGHGGSVLVKNKEQGVWFQVTIPL